LSDGKLTVGTNTDGSGVVTIIPPENFLADGSALNSQVILQAFMIDYSYIESNITTAWSHATAVATKRGIAVTTRPNNGPAGLIKFMGVDITGGEDPLMPYGASSAYYFRQLGMNLFNLFTSWSRIQPTPGSGSLDDAEIASLTQAVEYITNQLQAFCVIELHDFARFKGTPLGSGAASAANFAQVWTLLATQFKENPRVLFSLTNEPHDQSQFAYISAVNAAIAGIRGTGSDNYVLVQGNRWSSALNWFDIDFDGVSNADALLTVSDPSNKVIFNVHQYFDSTRGGVSDGCLGAGVGVQYLSGVTQWLKQNNKLGLLGEFGANDDPVCKETITQVLDYVSANADVWTGWAWWNAGTYLMDASKLSIEPVDGVAARPQQYWITPYVANKCPVDSTAGNCAILSGLESPIEVDPSILNPGGQKTEGPSKRANSAINVAVSIGAVVASIALALLNL